MTNLRQSPAQHVTWGVYCFFQPGPLKPVFSVSLGPITIESTIKIAVDLEWAAGLTTRQGSHGRKVAVVKITSEHMLQADQFGGVAIVDQIHHVAITTQFLSAGDRRSPEPAGQ